MVSCVVFSVLVPGHWRSSFADKPMIQQHRLLHKVLEVERKTIHALTLKTFTPDAWEKKKQEQQQGEEEKEEA